MSEAPLPVELYCPSCRLPHVDEGVWQVKLHRTRQCQGCYHEWRPYPFPTVGVSRVEPGVSFLSGVVVGVMFMALFLLVFRALG